MTEQLYRRRAGESVPLAECPVGLFECGDELCLKSEYSNNEGRIDAYIVSSGEFFWGAASQTIASQRASMVTPIEFEPLPAPAPDWTDEHAVALRYALSKGGRPRRPEHTRADPETLQAYRDLERAGLVQEIESDHAERLHFVATEGAQTLLGEIAAPAPDAREALEIAKAALEASRRSLWLVRSPQHMNEDTFNQHPTVQMIDAALARIGGGA